MTRTDLFGNKSIITNYGPSKLFVESFACAGVDSIPLDVAAMEDTRILVVDSLRIIHICENTCPFHRQTIYNLMIQSRGRSGLSVEISKLCREGVITAGKSGSAS